MEMAGGEFWANCEKQGVPEGVPEARVKLTVDGRISSPLKISETLQAAHFPPPPLRPPTSYASPRLYQRLLSTTKPHLPSILSVIIN
jgi:hypothetical protein